MAPTRRAFGEYTPWSKEEDAKLRTLVAQYGTARGKGSRWQELAEHLPGRSAKNCRKRWFYSLDPTVKRSTPWSAEEDAKLRELIAIHGKLWWRIAQDMDGRTDDQCCARYLNVLSVTDRPWSAEEDSELLVLQSQLGNKWKEIATHFEGRSALSCRNRCRKFLYMAKSRQAAKDGPDTMRSRSSLPRSRVSARSQSTSSESSVSSGSSVADPSTPVDMRRSHSPALPLPLSVPPTPNKHHPNSPAAEPYQDPCGPLATPDQDAFGTAATPAVDTPASLPPSLQDLLNPSCAFTEPPEPLQPAHEGDSMFAALASAAMMDDEQLPSPFDANPHAQSDSTMQGELGGPLAALVQALASPQGMRAGGVSALGALGMTLPTTTPTTMPGPNAFSQLAGSLALGMPGVPQASFPPNMGLGMAAALAALMAASQLPSPMAVDAPTADSGTWQALDDIVRRIVPDAGRAQIALDLVRHLAVA